MTPPPYFSKNAGLKATFIAALLVIGGYALWHLFSSGETDKKEGKHPSQTAVRGPSPFGKGGGKSMPAIPVQASAAQQKNVPQYLSGLGTILATNTTTVQSTVSGQLIAIHFTEGQEIKKGELLAEIDPRPFEVAAAQAKGQLAKNQALLKNSRRDLARYEKLAKTNLVSQQELDTQRSLVEQLQGSVKSDEAGVASANLNLSYSRITAPISGRVGLKKVDIGNMITSGSATGIVSITQADPIDMLFSLPENDIQQILQAQKEGLRLPAEAWDRGNKVLLAKGVLLSLDNQIDPTTGTIKLKARFDNKDGKLFPNQFVNARLNIGTLENAIVIPPGALQMNSEGYFVWAIDPKNIVKKKKVIPGFQDSETAIILSGLQAGERVVTDGLDRLIEDAIVEIVRPASLSDSTSDQKMTSDKIAKQREPS